MLRDVSSHPGLRSQVFCVGVSRDTSPREFKLKRGSVDTAPLNASRTGFGPADLRLAPGSG